MGESRWVMWIPACGIRVLCQQWTNSHRLQKSCGEKGTAWPLSNWERGQESQREPQRARSLPWQACFSGHITLRMILIYYAQVHCRWLHFTDNKGQNAANYFKQKDVTDQGGKWLNWLYSILGRFSTDFRKLKVLSKFLLPQPGWGSFSKSKSHSTLGTMQAWLPMGEPVRGRGPVCWTSHPLAFPSGSWATFPTRGTVPYMGTC